VPLIETVDTDPKGLYRSKLESAIDQDEKEMPS
jgi:hypothetical protein